MRDCLEYCLRCKKFAVCRFATPEMSIKDAAFTNDSFAQANKIMNHRDGSPAGSLKNHQGHCHRAVNAIPGLLVSWLKLATI